MGIPTGIGSVPYDDFADWIAFFFVPLFFILPGLFPAVKKRSMYLGCGLSILLVMGVVTNRDLVFFLITGHHAYLESFFFSPSIEPIAWILPRFYIVYSVLTIGLGKLGYRLYAKIVSHDIPLSEGAPGRTLLSC